VLPSSHSSAPDHPIATEDVDDRDPVPTVTAARSVQVGLHPSPAISFPVVAPLAVLRIALPANSEHAGLATVGQS
jgi:hypothetical protein